MKRSSNVYHISVAATFAVQNTSNNDDTEVNESIKMDASIPNEEELVEKIPMEQTSPKPFFEDASNISLSTYRYTPFKISIFGFFRGYL